MNTQSAGFWRRYSLPKLLLVMAIATGSFFIASSIWGSSIASAAAATPVQIDQKAQAFCSQQVIPAQVGICKDAYKAMFKAHSPNDYNNLCSKYTAATPNQAACTIGRAQGNTDGEEDRKNNPSTANPSTSTISDAELVKMAKADSACQAGATKKKNSCIAGFIAGYKFKNGASKQDAGDFCKNGKKVAAGYTVSDTTACRDGFTAGTGATRSGSTSGTDTTTADPDTGGSPSASGEADDCDTKFYNPITWVVCPIIDGVNKAVDELDNAINDLLTVNTASIFCTQTKAGECTSTDTKSGTAYYQAWDSFRKIALGLIFIVALLIIIASAFGYELLDAYTIRKTLPRVLIAIIFITLSWSILQFLINFTNDVGNGLRWIIYEPFGGMQDAKLGGAGQGISFLLLGTGVIALGILGLLSFGLTALLAALIAFAVLVLRELVIVFLVIMAPIGIACLIFPNTRKMWQLWQNTMTTMLVAFPLITAIIATGRVFSNTIYNGNPDNGMTQIIAFLAYLLPYFMLPFAFRLAGGVLATLAGIANDRSKGGFDRLKGYRGQKLEKNMHALKEGNRIKSSNFAARRFNSATRGIANAPSAGMVPWKMKSRYQAGMAQHEQQAVAEYMEKSAAFKAVMGNDDYLQATMKNMGGGDTEADWRRYLSANGYSGRSLEQGVAAIRAAKRDTNDHTFKRAAVVANASTGTGWKEGGAGAMMESINEAAGGDRDAAAQMLAEMRGRAERSRRVDLHGAGFGGQMVDLNAMHEGSLSTEEATRRNNKKVLQLQDSRTIAGSRGDSMKLLAPEMMDEVRGAYASGNDVTIKRTLARAAALYDNAQYSSDENAQLMADQMLAQPTGKMLQRPVRDDKGNIKYKQRVNSDGAVIMGEDGNPVMDMVTENAVDADGKFIPETLRDQIERYRGDREFLNMRRELSAGERYAGGNREAATPPPPPEP